MPGFYINTQSSQISLENLYPERCIYEVLRDTGITIKRHTLNKFLKDKAFFETEDIAVVSEGMILNLSKLCTKYNAENINQLMSLMYKDKGETFFSSFIGAFSGALFDKKNNIWLIWTNQVGDKAVFYSEAPELFAAGSQVNYLIDAFKEAGAKLTFDEQAAYQMLTFGFMEGENTYAHEIKRLRGGQYLCYQNGKLEVKEYFTLHHHPERFNNLTESELLNRFDSLMRKASELEYSKDEEYHFEHLADLSGGLDARMNMWVAHCIKKRHLQFMTYCKANYKDETIAKQLANYWGDEIVVKPLDDLSFLYEIDDIVFMNGGLSLYSGITGGKRMLEHLNMDVYGIEHTGQLNGAIIGTYLSSIGGGKNPTGMYSEKLMGRLTGTAKENFEDHEIYMLYTRGFHGVMNTQQIRSNFTEAWTTASHPSVMQFCMDIPSEKRLNHSFYKKWIIAKYPAAARFKWEKTSGKITEKKWIGVIRKVITRGPNKIKQMLGLDKKIKSGMNPLDYWLSNNEAIRQYLDRYENRGYSYLPKETSAQLINDMKQLYAEGTANEKTMVLTVLASAKLYFGEKNACTKQA